MFVETKTSHSLLTRQCLSPIWHHFWTLDQKCECQPKLIVSINPNRSNRNLAIFERMLARVYSMIENSKVSNQVLWLTYQAGHDMLGGKSPSRRETTVPRVSCFTLHKQTGSVRMAKTTTKRRSDVIVVCMYCTKNIGDRNRNRHLAHCTVWKRVQEEKEGRDEQLAKQNPHLLSRTNM